MPVRANVAAASDIGRRRERNEDSFAIADQYGLYVVADGMGGHRAGSVASRLATESIVEFFTRSEDSGFVWPFHMDPRLTKSENRLLSAIRVANREVFDQGRQKRDWEGMGTTVVAAHLDRDTGRVYLGHVGDSRAYRIRSTQIQQLTRDHSLASEVRLRAADPRAAEGLPKNILTRALGSNATSVVDLSHEASEPGDYYLLCSDGLTGAISDAEILQIVIGAQRVDLACRLLVEAANENGGDDNVTVLIAHIERDVTRVSLESPPARVSDAREALRGFNTEQLAGIAEIAEQLAHAARQAQPVVVKRLYDALSKLIER